MEPAPPMEPPPAHLLGGGEVGDEISDIDDDADEIAHSFAYVRWNEPERNLRLFQGQHGVLRPQSTARILGVLVGRADAQGHLRDPLQCQARESTEKARVQANRRDMRISI